jgi:DNA-binding SARP family transcriptional activator
MIDLRVLGDPQLTRDGAGVALQRKPLALLAYLALAGRGRFVQRDTLLGVFWPELDQPGARAALRQALHTLRRALGDEVIVTEGDERVALDHDRVMCDLLEFDRAIREGQLRTAVELYRGPVLAGVHLEKCPEFEHWLDGQQGPAQRSYELAVEQLADLARSKGDHRRAADWLRRLLQVDPLQSRVAALLMEELEAAGEREEAIRVGERHGSSLQREWDAAPDPRIRELLRRLRQAPARVEAPLPGRAAPLRCEIEMVREALAGRYDVLEQLGGGLMAKVFLAWDVRLRRHVAVKVLKPDIRALLGAERFVQEIGIVTAFNHPNIVPLFETDEVGGFLYFTMRHIPGEPLNERIRRERYLPLGQAVRFATEVARGLQYSHDRNVVHRDVKPRNILLHEGSALIADFGTAIILAGGGKRLTQSGVLVGTPGYMSPEQSDPNGAVDGRSDVYGLGCVLYEMVTGEPVFTGATMHAVINKHRLERVTSIRIARPDAPAALDQIVARALAKAPGDRFATAAAFAEALEGLSATDR